MIKVPFLRLLPHVLFLLLQLLLFIRRQALQQRHILSLDNPMERPYNAIHIIDRQLSYISHRLNLGRTLLVFLVRHINIQLHRSALNGVPARQS